MKYEFKGKKINIDDAWIEKSMKTLEMTKEEVIEMYLEDEGYLDNEEQIALDAKASEVKIDHGAKADKPKRKSTKGKTTKPASDMKKQVFTLCWEAISAEFGENARIFTENKLIYIKNGEKTIKIDFVDSKTIKFDAEKSTK